MRYGIAQWSFVPRWRVYLFLLLLATVTILAYRPAWRGGSLWDDDAYLSNSEILTTKNGMSRNSSMFETTAQHYRMVYTLFRITRTLCYRHLVSYLIVIIM